MYGFFGVIVLDVGELPNIAGVFALGVTGEFADVGALEVALVGVLGRHPYGVEVPDVVVGFGPPVDRFIATRQSLGAVQAVSEVPDDAISQLQTEVFEDWIKEGIEGDDLAVVHVVAYLPADGTPGMQHTNTFLDDARLVSQILVNGRSGFVGLAQVVGRRRYDQLDAFIGDLPCERKGVFAGDKEPPFAVGTAAVGLYLNQQGLVGISRCFVRLDGKANVWDNLVFHGVMVHQASEVVNRDCVTLSVGTGAYSDRLRMSGGGWLIVGGGVGIIAAVAAALCQRPVKARLLCLPARFLDSGFRRNDGEGPE